MEPNRLPAFVLVACSLFAALFLVLLIDAGTDRGEQHAAGGGSGVSRPLVGAVPGPVRAPAEGLELDLLLPAALTPGSNRIVSVEVRDLQGGRPDGRLLELRFDLDLQAAVRGAIWISPEAALVDVKELRSRPPRLTTARHAACMDDPGTVTVRVRDLRVGGPAVERSFDLPRVVCEQHHPPAAPAAVHVLTPVCGDHRERDLRMLVDGERPPPAECRPSRRSPQPSAPTDGRVAASDDDARAQEPPDAADASPDDDDASSEEVVTDEGAPPGDAEGDGEGDDTSSATTDPEGDLEGEGGGSSAGDGEETSSRGDADEGDEQPHDEDDAAASSTQGADAQNGAGEQDGTDAQNGGAQDEVADRVERPEGSGTSRD